MLLIAARIAAVNRLMLTRSIDTEEDAPAAVAGAARWPAPCAENETARLADGSAASGAGQEAGTAAGAARGTRASPCGCSR